MKKLLTPLLLAFTILWNTPNMAQDNVIQLVASTNISAPLQVREQNVPFNFFTSTSKDLKLRQSKVKVEKSGFYQIAADVWAGSNVNGHTFTVTLHSQKSGTFLPVSSYSVPFSGEFLYLNKAELRVYAKWLNKDETLTLSITPNGTKLYYLPSYPSNITVTKVPKRQEQ